MVTWINKKWILAIFLAVTAAGAASAQVTISVGGALGYAKFDQTGVDADVGFGGNLYIDYLLPIGVPLSLGVEGGYDTSTLGEDPYKVTIGAIPLLGRVAYHLDLMPQLDLYLVGKIGYAFYTLSGNGTSGFKTEGGIGFGFDIGVCFYFTSNVGIFAEAGFDSYNGGAYYEEEGIKSETIKATYSRFFTFGLSLKF